MRDAEDSLAPGPVTLARAFLWSELRGQGWKLFAFPVAIGAVIAAATLFAGSTPLSLDAATTSALHAAATRYFARLPPDRSLVLALIVVQGPSIVTMFAAILSLLMVQNGLAKRLAVGEFELLLSAPYRDRDVFAALVLGASALSLVAIAILEALSVGVGLGVLLAAGAQLTETGTLLFAAGVIAPVPMALWATFVGVVVYLVFPEAATNNSHPANLLVVVALAPAIALVIATTAPTGVDPLVLALAANLVPLTAIAVGWVTVRRWFSVRRVL